MSNNKPLNSFKPYWWQSPLFEARKRGIRNIVYVIGRRGGKDLACWNLMILEALKRKGVYYYCAPKYSSVRKIIWDNMTIEGESFLSYIPRELIEKKNEQRMAITLVNGSQIQLIGSDSYNTSIVGSNCMGLVMSEASRANLDAYRYTAPILAKNGGFFIANSTPFGRNEFYDLFKMAERNPESWFTYLKGNNETKHIDQSEIDRLIREGFMSPDLVKQEFDCDWNYGATGHLFAQEMNLMQLEDRITPLNYNPGLKVHTAWDLGYAKNMVVLFFAVNKNGSIHIIDCLQLENAGLTDYVRTVLAKDFTYGKHIGPHDINTHEVGTGQTRSEIARNLGLNFTQATDVGLWDGIERIKIELSRVYIDPRRCSKLVKALENYRMVYDEERQYYKRDIFKDWTTHWVDAMRYMAISLHLLTDGLTPSELDRIKQRAFAKDNPYQATPGTEWYY